MPVSASFLPSLISYALYQTLSPLQTDQVLLSLRFALLRVADVSDLAKTFDTEHQVSSRLSEAVGGAVAKATAAIASAQARVATAAGSVRSSSPLFTKDTVNAAVSGGFAAAHESLRAVRSRLGSAVQVRVRCLLPPCLLQSIPQAPPSFCPSPSFFCSFSARVAAGQ